MDPESLGLVVMSFVLLTAMIFLVQYIGTYLSVALFLARSFWRELSLGVGLSGCI
jgi:hypothetical protein